MATITRRETFNKALKNFAATLDQLTVTAVDGSRYVRISALSEWMRDFADELEGRWISRTELLANAVYHGWRDFPPIISNEGSNCCVIVFSILLDLGLGHRVHDFTQKGIVDSNLPQDLATLKNKFKPQKGDGEYLANKFNERQWKFSLAQFSENMDEEFFENRVFRFVERVT
jgi:hypothetical protein